MKQLRVIQGRKDKFFRVFDITELNYHSIHPAIYTTYFHDPDQCHLESTYCRDFLPKHEDKITDAIRERQLEGLFIQHTVLGGRILIALMIIITFVFADIWSAKNSDLSGGFGVGAYVLAAIPVIALFGFNR